MSIQSILFCKGAEKNDKKGQHDPFPQRRGSDL